MGARRARAAGHARFVFRVRNLPAALYKALGGFATNGVNMTKLESYMVDGNFFATQFYADVDGHPDDQRARLCAGGTEILLARIPHRRRLSRASVPRDVQRDAGLIVAPAKAGRDRRGAGLRTVADTEATRDSRGNGSGLSACALAGTTDLRRRFASPNASASS